MLLGAHAGPRISEALALSGGDVTAGPGATGGEVLVHRRKEGKQRRLPVSGTLVAAIAALQADHPDLSTVQPLLRYRRPLEARRRLERRTGAVGMP